MGIWTISKWLFIQFLGEFVDFNKGKYKLMLIATNSLISTHYLLNLKYFLININVHFTPLTEECMIFQQLLFLLTMWFSASRLFELNILPLQMSHSEHLCTLYRQQLFHLYQIGLCNSIVSSAIISHYANIIYKTATGNYLPGVKVV